MKLVCSITILLLLILLYGCAYYDPLILESAEVLPAKQASFSVNGGITNNPIPIIETEDDTLWAFANDIIETHKYGFALRPKFKLGLGNGFEMALSGNVTMVPDSIPGDFFDLDEDLGYMAKLSLKKVWNLDSDRSVAILPSYSIHYGAYKSEINADQAQLWIGGYAQSWDLPIILSRKNVFGTSDITASLILRPGYTLLDRSMRYAEYQYGHLYDDIVLNVASDLPETDLERFAILHGLQKKAAFANYYLELGAELVRANKETLLMPVAGLSIEFTLDFLKNHE